MKKMLVRLLSTILAVMLTVNTPILSVFAEDSGSNTSGDLARFLQSLTIETMDGKTVTKEDLEIGDQYQVKMNFEVPDDQSLLFGAATVDELIKAGVPEDSEYLVEGEWMYICLGSNITASEVVDTDGNVVILNCGKTILFKFPGVGQTKAFINFTGTLNEGANLENLEIVSGSTTGKYEPQPSTVPKVKKESVGYDAENHLIHYTVTVTKPEEYDEEIETLTVKDVIKTEGATFVEKSLQIDGIPVDSKYLRTTESGFTLENVLVNFGDDNKVVITYDVNVDELLRSNSGSAASFDVDNDVSVYPNGKTEPDPLTDDETYQVHLGKLEKNGWAIDGNKIEWWIEVYDPYLPLDGIVITDVLPDNLTPVSLSFVSANDETGGVLFSDSIENLITNGTVKFDEGEQKLTITLPTENYYADEGHHRAFIVLRTSYPEGEAGHGAYKNVAQTTLPSEIVERQDDKTVYIGEPGIDVDKTGRLASDGKKISYDVTVYVASDIPQEGEAAGGIIAGLSGIMHIKVGGEGGQDVLLETSTALEVESIVATYEDDTGEEKTWEFTKDGGIGHTFGVYAVIPYDLKEFGGPSQLVVGKGILSSDEFVQTVIFFNPKEEDVIAWGNNLVKVSGDWPDALAKHDVKLSIKYTIDPAKAYFLTAGSPYFNKSPLEGKYDTLADYLKATGDVVVYNEAEGNIWGATGADNHVLNLVTPLKKDGEVRVEPTDSARYADYTVTFHNGIDNDSAIPRGASDIVFKDTFDSRMKYVEGTLRVTLVESDGTTTKDFYYMGGDPVNENNTITAKWSDFVDAAHTTNLQADFNSRTGHYQYKFTYTLEPDEDFADDVVTQEIYNKAWIEFSGGTLAPVEEKLDFPTGALTKEAALENGQVVFYVEINESKAKLSYDGKLTVVDNATVDEYVTLDTDSVTVEKFKDGSWVALGESEYTKTVGSDGKLTLTVPDGTHLRIRYEYSLKDDAPANVSIKNEVTINGTAIKSDDKTWNFTTSQIEAGSSGSITSFTLQKVSQAAAETKLSGAKFILYGPNTFGENTTEAANAANEIDNPDVTNNVGTKLNPVAVYTTSADGTVDVNWGHIWEGVTYALVESKAPDGYECLSTPILFKISGNTIQILNTDALKEVGIEVETSGKMMTVADPPITGSLTVEKKVVVNGGNIDPEKEFTFTVKAGDDVKVDVDNVKVTINKKDGSTNVSTQPFTDRAITVELKAAESATIEGLPIGSYTVTENEETAQSNGYTLNVTGDKTATVTADKVVNATVTNTYEQKRGSLTITKEVVGGGNEAANKTYTFTVKAPSYPTEGHEVSVTVKKDPVTGEVTGTSKTLENLIPGEYTITENETDVQVNGYTLNVTYGETADGKITVEADETVSAEITVTNTYTPEPEYGSLTITKSVAGTGADTDKTFAFTITLTDATVNGTYGELTFTNGVATFVLRDGKSVWARDLPIGVGYTVTELEANYDGYETTSVGAIGVIAEDTVNEVRFINHRGDGDEFDEWEDLFDPDIPRTCGDERRSIDRRVKQSKTSGKLNLPDARLGKY